MNNRLVGAGLSLAVVATLGACGGGGGDDEMQERSASGSGELTLRITDAPVDGATAVNITIKSVELKRSGTTNTKRITMASGGLNLNLLDYSDSTLPLFTEKVSSGEYQWARFELENDATICFATCQDLEIPRNMEIKTSRAFSVPSNGVVDYVVDWDLRKSVVETNNGYQLKPVLHLRPYSSNGTTTVGYIEGSISAGALSNCASPAVYLYPVTAAPDDIYPGDSVLASVLVSGGSFFLGSLEPGNYRLAFTCNANNDSPDTNDNNVNFPFQVDVTVPSGGAATWPLTYPFESP